MKKTDSTVLGLKDINSRRKSKFWTKMKLSHAKRMELARAIGSSTERDHCLSSLLFRSRSSAHKLARSSACWDEINLLKDFHDRARRSSTGPSPFQPSQLDRAYWSSPGLPCTNSLAPRMKLGRALSSSPDLSPDHEALPKKARSGVMKFDRAFSQSSDFYALAINRKFRFLHTRSGVLEEHEGFGSKSIKLGAF